MQLRYIASGIAALAFAAGLAIRASADESEKTKTTLAITDVPAAVQAAIKQFAGSNPIEKITKESEDNTDGYEATVKIAGVKNAVEVLPNGTVKQTEKDIALNDAPGAVQAAAKKLADNGAVNEITEETAGSKKSYEVSVTINGKKKEADISADGKIEEDEDQEKNEEHGNKD